MRVGASDAVGSYSMRYVGPGDESDDVGELYKKTSYKTRPYHMVILEGRQNAEAESHLSV